MSTRFAQLVRTVAYIEDIQMFLLNMAFILSSEVKKYLYFMSGEATNEIYIFFTSRVKLKPYSTKII